MHGGATRRRALDNRTLGAVLLLVACALQACSRPQPSDPLARLPTGFVDLPLRNAVITRKVAVRGWAIDDVGIAEVRLFLGQIFVADVNGREARPDVEAAYPSMKVTGWTETIALPADTPTGTKTMIVQVIDTTGLSRVIGVIPVTLQ